MYIQKAKCNRCDKLCAYCNGVIDGYRHEIESLQKELAEVKADVAFYKERCLYTEGLEKELAELRAELKETDMLIQKLYDKTRGKQPF